MFMIDERTNDKIRDVLKDKYCIMNQELTEKDITESIENVNVLVDFIIKNNLLKEARL